jgi:hypothetical protein
VEVLDLCDQIDSICDKNNEIKKGLTCFINSNTDCISDSSLEEELPFKLKLYCFVEKILRLILI